MKAASNKFSRLFLRLMMVGISAQVILTFFLGKFFGLVDGPLEIRILGASWQISEILLYPLFYVWLLFEINRLRMRGFSFFFKELGLLYLFLAFLFGGLGLGFLNHNTAVFNDARGFFAFIVMFYVVCSANLDLNYIRKLLDIILLPAFVISMLIVLIRFLGIVSGIDSPFYVDHSVSFACVLGTIVSFSQLVFGRRIARNMLFFFSFFLSIALVFHKPMAIMTIIGLSTVLIYVAFFLNLPFKKKKTVYFFAVCIVFFVILFGGLAIIRLPQQLKDYYLVEWKYRYLREDVGDISSDRFLLWTIAADMIAQKPLTGYGVGVRLENPRFSLKYLELNVHNFYIHMFLTVGIIGGMAFLLLLFKYLRFVWTGIKQLTLTDLPLALGLWGYFFSFLSYNMGGLFLIYKNSAFMFAVCAAFLLKIVLINNKRIKEEFLIS
ncbi:MAG: O-antigen ligase family protein [Candidatus Saganbacteria bacterium]|nr:O-antigen ligase family protein [Candidatus Saganbacteria bacterium]